MPFSIAFPTPPPHHAQKPHSKTHRFPMENGDETLASPIAAAATETALSGGIAEEEVTVTAVHPAKSYAAVAASAEIEDLRAAKLDLEEKLASADRENKALSSEVHRLEGLFSQARDDVATADHAAATFEGEVASFRAEVERLRDLLKFEKGEREEDKRNFELLAAEVKAVRQVKLKLEKGIDALKASTPAVTAGEREAAPTAEVPKEAEVAWQGMAAAAAAGAAAAAAFVLVYLRLKR